MTSSFVTPVTFGRDDVEMLSRQTLYDGFFKMELYPSHYTQVSTGKLQPIRNDI